jgi:hypothetical protein
MKKRFILFISFSLIFFSCSEDPGPEPEVIRAYCYLYHFIPELSSVIWEAAGFEVPNVKVYAYQFAGAVILESDSEEIAFAVKHPDTHDVLATQNFQLEKDTYYNVIAYGSIEDPILHITEIETSRPQAGNIKFQVLHSATGENSIDLYMGDTTLENRVVNELDYLSLTDPFEAEFLDVRSLIIVSKHSEDYNQDSVLLTSINNGDFISDAYYLTVVAPFTYDPSSEFTLWIYPLPLD